jgi:hypothetical protein
MDCRAVVKGTGWIDPAQAICLWVHGDGRRVS